MGKKNKSAVSIGWRPELLPRKVFVKYAEKILSTIDGRDFNEDYSVVMQALYDLANAQRDFMAVERLAENPLLDAEKHAEIVEVVRGKAVTSWRDHYPASPVALR